MTQAKTSNIGSWNTADGSLTPSEHDYRQNACLFTCRDGTNDEDVVRSIFEGEYAVPNSSQYEAGSVSFDLGAHIGAYAIWACSQHQSLNVLCVEPIPENRKLLFKNTRHNDMQRRVACFDGAVGPVSEQHAVIHYTSSATEHGRIHHFVGNSVGFDKGNRSVTVPVVGLDDLLTRAAFIFNTSKIWTLKIDVEGGEYPFFNESSIESLKKIKWIVGEYHDGLGGVEKPLTRAGFRFVNYDSARRLFCFENPMPFSKL
jgi:FkbM family methyltransferase